MHGRSFETAFEADHMVAWILRHNFWILIPLVWIVTGHDFHPTPNIHILETIIILIITIIRDTRHIVRVEKIHVVVRVHADTRRRSAIELGITTNKGELDC